MTMEVNAVVQAYQQYYDHFHVTPDVEAVRKLMLTRHLDGKEDRRGDLLFKHLEAFCEDMPDYVKQYAGGYLQELRLVWQDKKIRSILQSAALPFLTYEDQTVGANLKMPPTLRRAADALEKAQADGYSLFDLETNGDVVKWHLRRPVTRNLIVTRG